MKLGMKRLSAYWLCQLGGWGSYILAFTFAYFTIRTKPSPQFFPSTLIDVVIGVGITHVMRSFIKKTKLTEYNIRKQIICMVLTTIFFAFIYAIIVTWIDQTLKLESSFYSQYSFWNKTIRLSFGFFLILLIWNFIFFFFYFLEIICIYFLYNIIIKTIIKKLEI